MSIDQLTETTAEKTTDQPAVRVRDLTMRFTRRGGEQVHAIDGLSLDVAPGEIVSVLGPSGCGKTTLLRSVAGLNRPTDGSIWVTGSLCFARGGRTWIPPEKRHLGMMFQNYALWPHMTVFENVAYPLKMARVSKVERARRVEEALVFASVGELAKEHPSRLSGGQQQRVALARSIVARPKVVLFDEPLSNVDAKVRDELRIELLRMQRSLGFAALYVTHDQEEALLMGHRLVVLDRGKIAQIGTPTQVYRTPNSAYVAEFMGTGNVFEGKTVSHGSDVVLPTPLGNLPAPCEAGIACTGIVRAHDIDVLDHPGSESVEGIVEAQMFLGASVQIIVRVGDELAKVSVRDRNVPDVGASILLHVSRATVVPVARGE